MLIEQQLEEAKSAYHKLLTGKAVVSIQRDGKKVDYTPANLYQLKQYISELETLTGAARGRRGPIGVQ